MSSREVGGARESHGTRLDLNRLMRQGVPPLDAEWGDPTARDIKAGDRVGVKADHKRRGGQWGIVDEVCHCPLRPGRHCVWVNMDKRFETDYPVNFKEDQLEHVD